MTPKISPPLSCFNQKQIQKILINNEWYFSIVDIVSMITNEPNATDCWQKIKTLENHESNNEFSKVYKLLKLTAEDGKKYKTDCANTEGIFRIIQSIPSPKAEPFKQWLAKIGKERIDEIENPELGIERVKKLYEKKGYEKIPTACPSFAKMLRLAELLQEELEKILKNNLDQVSFLKKNFYLLKIKHLRNKDVKKNYTFNLAFYDFKYCTWILR
jgi:hypothetical protein